MTTSGAESWAARTAASAVAASAHTEKPPDSRAVRTMDRVGA